MSLHEDERRLNTAQDAVDKVIELTGKFELVRVDDLRPHPPRWLIRGVLEEGTLAMVFGEPGVGKSFLAVSMACCIATGSNWNDREVKKGMVVYIAGEGHGGLGRRLKAWSIKHGVDLAGSPLRVSKGPAALSDPGTVDAVSEAIRQAQEEESEVPRLVIIDTLARNFGSGDENSTKDMQEFIKAVDELRQRHGCTVLIVHHTGHAEKGRARGAIALKGAVDAEYRIQEQSGRISLESTKMKDGPCPSAMSLKLETVKLPLMDEYDKTATSAVLITVTSQTGGRKSE